MPELRKTVRHTPSKCWNASTSPSPLRALLFPFPPVCPESHFLPTIPFCRGRTSGGPDETPGSQVCPTSPGPSDRAAGDPSGTILLSWTHRTERNFRDRERSFGPISSLQMGKLRPRERNRRSQLEDSTKLSIPPIFMNERTEDK